MTFHLFVITLIACPLITIGQGNSDNAGQGQNQGNSGQGQNQGQNDSPPHCPKANVPFKNETAAFEYTKQFWEECRFEYWKVGNTYHGMNGYKQMYGDIGYMYNKSTVFDIDGRPVHGYMNARAKCVVAQNMQLISATSIGDIQLLAWSEYEVFYSGEAHAVLNIPSFTAGSALVKTFVRMTWFNDSSGIIKYVRQNSTSSILGSVVSGAITTTQAISEQLGYLNDDGIDYSNNYIKNPIRFIFIGVFCALTVFIATCVYMFLKCTLSGKNGRLKTVNIDSIGTHSGDDSQELHRLKN